MRNADYIPVGQIPMIDLGAQYEAAKARREEAENRKLEYLSQFKRVRGPLTDGLKPEIQKRWDSIESLLDEGDMSLDGRKKLQQQYQDYADFASYGVDFTRALDEREAEVLANPERYNLDVLRELETYRTVTPTAESFMNMSLPSLSQYAKYTPKKMSPKEMAFSVYENAKNFDALDNFRNRDGSINSNAVKEAVAAQYIGLTDEEIRNVAADRLAKLGRLTGSVDDVYALDSLTKDDLLRYQEEHMAEVEQRLLGELAKDVETDAEKRAAELRDYAAKVGIQGRQSEKEIRLRAQMDKEAEAPKATRNIYAPLVTFLEDSIADNILVQEEADTAPELQKTLSKIGFTVEQAKPGKDAIKIKSPDGKEVVIDLPSGIDEDAALKKSVREQVLQAVINNLPGENEGDKLMYLNRLYSSGIVPQGGDLNP
jgi:hypothetical protein